MSQKPNMLMRVQHDTYLVLQRVKREQRLSSLDAAVRYLLEGSNKKGNKCQSSR